MKKIFLCLAILALLGSDLAFARGGHGGGGRGGGGRGGASARRGGARGGRGGGVRHDGRGRRDGRGGRGRHRGGHYYGHHRHYHGGHWYNYNSGWYLYAGLWYPFWAWPYRTETDVVIWQETPPADARYAEEDKLDDLEEQSYQLRQRQADLDARMRVLEKK